MPSTPSPGPLSQKDSTTPNPEALKRALGHVQREHDLINHRLSWLLTSQSLLLAAYAILHTMKDKNLDIRVSVIALLSCIVISASIGAAMRAIRYFRIPARMGELEPAQVSDGPKAIGVFRLFPIRFPQYEGDKNLVGPTSSHLLGYVAPIFVPAIFSFLWISLIIDQLHPARDVLPFLMIDNWYIAGDGVVATFLVLAWVLVLREEVKGPKEEGAGSLDILLPAVIGVAIIFVGLWGELVWGWVNDIGWGGSLAIVSVLAWELILREVLIPPK